MTTPFVAHTPAGLKQTTGFYPGTNATSARTSIATQDISFRGI